MSWLELAERKTAWVVSNDEFDAYRDEYHWIEKRRVPLMTVDVQVTLYQPAFDQDGQAEHAEGERTHSAEKGRDE